MVEESYSTGEFAEKTGLHFQTVKRYCREGEINYKKKPGGHRRIPHSELENYTIENNLEITQTYSDIGMRKSPEISVIVYGSILNPDELNGLLNDTTGRICPIRVSGFKRIFNQEASWRETNDKQRAVLNVVQSPDSWFNGILINNLSQEEFRNLHERERGYRFIEVENNQIEYYKKTEIDTEAIDISFATNVDKDLILTTTGKKANDFISPIPDYVDLCKEGAESWGKNFFEDFIRSTETNSGDTLADSLDS